MELLHSASHTLKNWFSAERIDTVSKWLIDDYSESISLSLHLLTFYMTDGCVCARFSVLSTLALGHINSTSSSEARTRPVSSEGPRWILQIATFSTTKEINLEDVYSSTIKGAFAGNKNP